MILDKYTIIEQQESYIVYNWLQYFDEQTIRQEFTKAGLNVVELFDDVAGTPFTGKTNELAIVASK